jgi:F-type H+-transporting ATPase subunit b
MELISNLGIDWKLLVAQIVNFCILLFILYKFVYKPVLDMLDKRTAMIEKGVTDAKLAEEQLVKTEKMRDEKMKEAKLEIGKMLDTAKSEAEAMKKELIEASSIQAQDLLRRAKIQIEEEKTKMMEEVRREVGKFIVTVVGKVIEKEFSAADQARLVDAVAHEMKSVK